MFRLISILCLAAVLLASTRFASAQTFTVLDNLHNSTGIYPAAPLVENRSGNLAGSTAQGGSNGYGTLLGLTSQGKLSGVLNNMKGAGNIQLLLGQDGYLYGTTYGEGTEGAGTVFKIDSNGTITTLHTFLGPEGAYPTSGLTLGNEGNFYGTTSAGGAHNMGTIYKITPAGVVTALHSFDDYDFLTHPSRLTLGNDGNFYGTTQNGQSGGVYGEVFQVTPSGKFTVIYQFADPTQSPSLSGLTLGLDGDFYGTTANVGTPGTIYKVSTSGVFSTLYAFSGTDGASPDTPVIIGSDGNFFGVAYSGGAYSYGTIYRITPAGVLTDLYDFDQTHGSHPYFISQHTNGTLYGMTTSGGLDGLSGVIYSMDAALPAFTTTLPPFGQVNSVIELLGPGFTGATAVSFNGVPASRFKVISDTYMTAVVPQGATTGLVTVTTPSGPLTSKLNFVVE